MHGLRGTNGLDGEMRTGCLVEAIEEILKLLQRIRRRHGGLPAARRRLLKSALMDTTENASSNNRNISERRAAAVVKPSWIGCW